MTTQLIDPEAQLKAILDQLQQFYHDFDAAIALAECCQETISNRVIWPERCALKADKAGKVLGWKPLEADEHADETTVAVSKSSDLFDILKRKLRQIQAHIGVRL